MCTDLHQSTATRGKEREEEGGGHEAKVEEGGGSHGWVGGWVCWT